MTYYAECPITKRKAIRGAVTGANIVLWVNNHVVKAMDFDKKYWPYQSNNMTEWFMRASRLLRNADLNTAIRDHSPLWKLESPEFMVLNDGQGVKEGTGANHNKFSLIIGSVKLEINTWYELHTTRYHKKVKSGQYTPPPPEQRHPGGRPKKVTNPFHDPKLDKWVVNMFEDEHGIERRIYADEKTARRDFADLLKMGMIDDKFKSN